MEYVPTIGLEIHAELKTQTKMFCACKNDPDEKRPNINICPVCMAHPGSLPVINADAVHKVLLVGTALGGTLADYTEFDRKNYFYPDIPKGYQISQYQHPLVAGGELNGVDITRVHLEEDTARSQHEGDKSLVDYNRAGVPLMELVTEPVIHDAATAGAFARELQLLLRYLGAGEANLEKGEMRVEANISVAPQGSTLTGPGVAEREVEPLTQLGTKVEVKNLNSFRSVERAIAYEVERQIKLLEGGGVVAQETRGWDEDKQSTFSQRKKEGAHDYRYFPDPDLPSLRLSEIPEFSIETLKQTLPELPWERRERYGALGLKGDDVDMFVQDPLYGSFFDSFLSAVPVSDSQLVLLGANYLASDIAGKVEKGEVARDWLREKSSAGRFVELMQLVRGGVLSSRGAKDTLALMFSDTRDPETIAKEKGLMQQSDTGMLEDIAKKVVDAHPQVATDYRAGKAAALQFLLGQGMKETKGSANPNLLREALIKVLG